MTALLVLVLIAAVIGGAVVWSRKQTQARAALALEDARAEARRWVERLGGQVYNLDGSSDPAAKQALADAGERYNAAGSQLEQAKTAAQCELATQTAMEGLYYIRAARQVMGLDPGPELPDLNGQSKAGKVSEERRVNVEGEEYIASPNAGPQTPNYYPGGMVAGRPVPEGWYSRPWWKTALIGGAWGVGSYLLFDAMFSGMHGISSAHEWESGYAAGLAADNDNSGGDWGDSGGDSGGDWGDSNDFGGGSDFGGGDWGGGGDFGGGDFGGGDW